MPATIRMAPMKYRDPVSGQYVDIVGIQGKGINSIAKTGTSGQTDTYTITYTDGTTSTYQVVNEANGEAYGAGKRNGVAVAEGDPAYHNNAPYYANLARNYTDGKNLDGSDSSQHSENNAEYWAGQAEASAEELSGAVEDVEALKSAIGGYNSEITLISGRMINGQGKWASSAANKYATIPISAGDIVSITAGRNNCYYAFLAAGDSGSSTVEYADGETGRRSVSAGSFGIISAPTGTHLLYMLYQSSSITAEHWPYRLLINGIDMTDSIRQEITDTESFCQSVYSLSFSASGQPAIQNGYSISGSGNWLTGNVYNYVMIPITAGDKISILANNRGISSAYYAFLAYPRIGKSTEVLFASGETGRHSISPGIRAELTAPAQSRYLYLAYSNTTGTGDYYFPDEVTINGVPIFNGTVRSQYGVFEYSTGSFLNGVANKKLVVALPQGNHYIAFTLYHYDFPDNNCKVWRIFSFDKLDVNLNAILSLSVKGEMECAVSLQGRPDFSGGSTHGDEIMTGWDLFLDGKCVTDDLANYTQVTPFKTLRLVRQSNLYDPNDNVTVIAEHGCEYIFTLDGLTIDQSLQWTGAYPLSNCYMAMFTPAKTVTDHFYTDTDFTPTEVTGSNYSITKPGAKKIVIYGESSGFMGVFSVERYPTGMSGGDKALITDNSGNGYNKCYFYICNSGTTTENELWRTTTKYVICA